MMDVVDRDKMGRFLPGSVHSPGRAPRDQERALQSAILALRAPAEIARCLLGYADQPRHAPWAWPLICRYAFSEPPRRVDVRGVMATYTLADMLAVRAALAGADLRELETADQDALVLPAAVYDNEEVTPEAGQGDASQNSEDIRST